MKKKVLKLAKGLTKFTLDDIQIMSEINESELLAILEELKKEGSLQTIKNNEYIYIPPVSKSAISTPQPENSRNDLKPENIIGYEAYLKTEGKQKVYAEKYFNLINACGNLKGEKLKNFIDNKWNKMFPEYRASYSRLIKIRKMFLQNGFYALLPCWNFNKGKSCILDELYSLFIDEYFSFNAPTLSEAARQAKKKFVELNPDFEICQLPAEGTFAKKLKREYTQEEISTFRSFAVKNKIKYKPKNEECKVKEPVDMLFKTAAAEFLKKCEQRLKKSTYISNANYIKNHLNPILADCKIGEITREMIDEIRKSKLEDGFSISSVNSYVDIAEQIIKEYIPTSNKLSKTEMHADKRAGFYSDIRILDPKDIKKLISTAKKYYPDFYPLVFTAITTGLTRGEILGLTWDCVDLKNKKLNIHKSLYRGEILKHRTKYSIRDVNLTDNTAEVLAKWNLNAVKSEFVFPDKNGNALDPDNMIKRRFVPLIEKAGIRKIRFIDLRDTYASLLIKQNIPLTYVQQQLGHSSVDVTVKRYEKLITNPQINSITLL